NDRLNWLKNLEVYRFHCIYEPSGCTSFLLVIAALLANSHTADIQILNQPQTKFRSKLLSSHRAENIHH
ncbi:hypothetical protein, partial [Culturomica sp.]|uniref:hypothetical protein n=1 Tax=Culturomica sp. TaxID=1926652 RepID=UPI00257C8A88